MNTLIHTPTFLNIMQDSLPDFLEVRAFEIKFAFLIRTIRQDMEEEQRYVFYAQLFGHIDDHIDLIDQLYCVDLFMDDLRDYFIDNYNNGITDSEDAYEMYIGEPLFDEPTPLHRLVHTPLRLSSPASAA
jgi:hypothetical protein